jgi:hypothetical protein
MCKASVSFFAATLLFVAAIAPSWADCVTSWCQNSTPIIDPMCQMPQNGVLDPLCSNDLPRVSGR